MSTPPRGLTPLVVAVATGAVFAPALLNGFVDKTAGVTDERTERRSDEQ